MGVVVGGACIGTNCEVARLLEGDDGGGGACA